MENSSQSDDRELSHNVNRSNSIQSVGRGSIGTIKPKDRRPTLGIGMNLPNLIQIKKFKTDTKEAQSACESIYMSPVLPPQKISTITSPIEPEKLRPKFKPNLKINTQQSEKISSILTPIRPRKVTLNPE